jgi:hypothetical protein
MLSLSVLVQEGGGEVQAAAQGARVCVHTHIVASVLSAVLFGGGDFFFFFFFFTYPTNRPFWTFFLPKQTQW